MTPFSVPGMPRDCFLCDGDTYHPNWRDPSRMAACTGCDAASTTGRFVIRAATAGHDEVELSRVFTRFAAARLRASRYAVRFRGRAIPAAWPGPRNGREVVEVRVYFLGTDGRRQMVYAAPVMDRSEPAAAVLDLAG